MQPTASVRLQVWNQSCSTTSCNANCSSAAQTHLIRTFTVRGGRSLRAAGRLVESESVSYQEQIQPSLFFKCEWKKRRRDLKQTFVFQNSQMENVSKTREQKQSLTQTMFDWQETLQTLNSTRHDQKHNKWNDAHVRWHLTTESVLSHQTSTHMIRDAFTIVRLKTKSQQIYLLEMGEILCWWLILK